MPSLLPPAVPPGRLNSQSQPEIVADDLLLRSWSPNDALGVSTAYDDPSIQRWHGRTMTPEEALTWVADACAGWSKETLASWAVVNSTGLAGRMTLRLHLADGWAEASYWVVPAARGNAVAPRALRAVASWSFDVGLHRVELQHSVVNEGSCRVAIKAGFRAEGTKRGAGLHIDGWHDMHLHSCTDADLRAATGAPVARNLPPISPVSRDR